MRKQNQSGFHRESLYTPTSLAGYRREEDWEDVDQTRRAGQKAVSVTMSERGARRKPFLAFLNKAVDAQRQ